MSMGSAIQAQIANKVKSTWTSRLQKVLNRKDLPVAIKLGIIQKIVTEITEYEFSE